MGSIALARVPMNLSVIASPYGVLESIAYQR
jgi:hypothetical protein